MRHVLGLWAILALGCATEGPLPQGSCDSRSVDMHCWEYDGYPGESGLTVTQLEGECARRGGTWHVAERCPRADAVGGCFTDEASVTTINWIYAGDAERLCGECEVSGATWLSP